jgi:hypothetical protein
MAVDRHGPGRGAWLCRGSLGCLEEAVRRHGFDRAFAAAMDAADVERLRRELSAAWGRPTTDVRGYGASLRPGPERNQGRREPLAEEDSRL